MLLGSAAPTTTGKQYCAVLIAVGDRRAVLMAAITQPPTATVGAEAVGAEAVEAAAVKVEAAVEVEAVAVAAAMAEHTA